MRVGGKGRPPCLSRKGSRWHKVRRGIFIRGRIFEYAGENSNSADEGLDALDEEGRMRSQTGTPSEAEEVEFEYFEHST